MYTSFRTTQSVYLLTLLLYSGVPLHLSQSYYNHPIDRDNVTQRTYLGNDFIYSSCQVLLISEMFEGALQNDLFV